MSRNTDMSRSDIRVTFVAGKTAEWKVEKLVEVYWSIPKKKKRKKSRNRFETYCWGRIIRTWSSVRIFWRDKKDRKVKTWFLASLLRSLDIYQNVFISIPNLRLKIIFVMSNSIKIFKIHNPSEMARCLPACIHPSASHPDFNPWFLCWNVL